MYSPFTPTNQYKPDFLVNIAKKNDIIDLSKVMEETNTGFDKLKKEIESFKKENA